MADSGMAICDILGKRGQALHSTFFSFALAARLTGENFKESDPNGTYLRPLAPAKLFPVGSNSFDHWELAEYPRSNVPKAFPAAMGQAQFDPTGFFANSTLPSGISNCPYKRVEVLK